MSGVLSKAEVHVPLVAFAVGMKSKMRFKSRDDLRVDAMGKRHQTCLQTSQ